MTENTTIIEVLRRIEGRQREAYLELVGHHDFKRFFLYIDLVEPRGPATVALIRARALKGNANYPQELWNTEPKRLALEDCISRLIRKTVSVNSIPQPEPKPGKRGAGRQRPNSPHQNISVETGRQEIIERTAVRVSPYWIEARLEVALPSHGNRVHGKEASEILTRELPQVVERCILWEHMPQERVRSFLDTAECYEQIQNELSKKELLAFIAEGALIARANRSGELPMEEPRAVRFESPQSLKVEIELPPLRKAEGEPQPRTVAGMGIAKGITVIVGPRGAGKSTLLRAIQQGIYAHVPGDGREQVATTPHAVKVNSDEGRVIGKLDISGFITTLPGGRDPKEFYAKYATETESFVAGLIEAVESGSKFLLIDQDLTPSELLFQDPRVAKLVNSAVTPLAKRLKDLWEKCAVSSLIVTESYGDFLAVADRVLLMQDFKLNDITEEAKRICAEFPSSKWEDLTEFIAPQDRIPLKPKLVGNLGANPFGIRVVSRSELMIRNSKIDLSALEQIGDRAQVQGLGYALHFILMTVIDGELNLSQILDRFEEHLKTKGFDYLSPFFSDGKHPGDFARPRREELQQILNRLPFLRIKRSAGGAEEGEVALEAMAEVPMAEAESSAEIAAEVGEAAEKTEEQVVQTEDQPASTESNV